MRKGQVHSVEVIERMKMLKSGKNNPMFDRCHSEKAKQEIGKGNLGIPRSKEVKEKISKTRIEKGLSVGENNAGWIDGRSYIPYALEFTDQLKREIRERDNNTCQFCGILAAIEQHSVHHINYDKEDCRKRNLITLCRSHNGEANFNMEKWQFCFETLQEIRGII